jgi:hypothetical protein
MLSETLRSEKTGALFLLSYAALAQANRFRLEPVSAHLHPAPFQRDRSLPLSLLSTGTTATRSLVDLDRH